MTDPAFPMPYLVTSTPPLKTGGINTSALSLFNDPEEARDHALSLIEEHHTEVTVWQHFTSPRVVSSIEWV